MAIIRIPPVLRPDAAGSRTVTVEAGTVRDALTSLVALHPALRERVLADDALPSYLNVFVDGDDIRLLGGLETQVADASTILRLPAVAGGA